MSTYNPSRLAFAICILLASATCATAQGKVAPDKASALSLRAARGQPNSVERMAAALKDARHSPMKRARADSIARMLTDVALDHNTSTVDGARALAAITTTADSSEGPAYHGSYELMSEVYREGPTPGRRGAAMRQLINLAPHEEVLSVWRAAATRTADPSFVAEPIIAIGLLCDRGGPQGRAILAELHRAGAVSDIAATRKLNTIMASNFKQGCAN